ncbi:MAG: patatin-like phospholipase family protein [Sandaracinaceae bacterium]|nr:patatin-like phospholipase family protein [Sandaracinaceae bacterium]
MKLVLEGGGNRAAFSAGVLLALERAGVPCEAIVGSSTSAVTAAYFAAGQMELGVRVWTEVMPDGLVSWRRLVTPWGRPALDLDRMIDDVLQKGWSRLDVDRLLEGAPVLYVVATKVPSGEGVLARPKREDLFEWLRASSALPVGYNRVVRIDGDDYVDSGLAAPVPFDMPLETPFEEPTVVILTRRPREEKQRPSWWQRAFLRLIVPEAIRGPSLRQHDLYNRIVRQLKAEEAAGRLILVTPPDDMTLSRLTRDAASLRRGVDIGLREGEALVARLKGPPRGAS